MKRNSRLPICFSTSLGSQCFMVHVTQRKITKNWQSDLAQPQTCKYESALNHKHTNIYMYQEWMMWKRGEYQIPYMYTILRNNMFSESHRPKIQIICVYVTLLHNYERKLQKAHLPQPILKPEGNHPSACSGTFIYNIHVPGIKYCPK